MPGTHARARPGLCAAALALCSAAALGFIWRRGYTLYYGDAEAHLNIARRIFDSRDPGLFQIGTVWLPLPHLLMLPFALSDSLWHSGLAGALPSALAFVAAGLFLYSAAQRLYDSSAAAIATLAIFALNPNLLYLQSAPMTEPLFFACTCALLHYCLRFRETQGRRELLLAAAASALGALTRYEGWFLIPFATLLTLLLARERRWRAALLFAAVASLGPLLWLLHNWHFWRDPLEFYRGPYSPQATHRAFLHGGQDAYPASHDWIQSGLYYWSAARLCLGLPLLLLGLLGLCAALTRERWSALFLLLPAPLFYVWLLHSGDIPIYVPQLWPHGAYNTRYGLAALPLCALACGAVVARLPRRGSFATGALVTAMAISPWLSPWPESSICFRESQANSASRRAWTAEAARYLRSHYRPGEGIVMWFGDLTGILREAGIPLREALVQDDLSGWKEAMDRPAVLGREEWLLTNERDQVAGILGKRPQTGPRYQCVAKSPERGEAAVEICKHG